MILNHITSRSRDPDQSGLANGPSRRRLLEAGAAVGGGLLLSVSLRFPNVRFLSSSKAFVTSQYALASGEQPGSKKRFGDEMRRLGFEPVDKAPGTQARGYLRIALKRIDAARDPYWQD